MLYLRGIEMPNDVVPSPRGVFWTMAMLPSPLSRAWGTPNRLLVNDLDRDPSHTSE